MKITNTKKINLTKKELEDIIREHFDLTDEAKIYFDLEEDSELDECYSRMIFTGVTIEETVSY